MSRPRTPTEVLERRGAFRHDPSRRVDRAAEPRPDGEVGEAPAYFDERLVPIWEELIGICPPHVLTNADRWIVELCCQLMLKLRTGTAPGLAPKAGMTGAELSQLIGALSRLGMTPADRSRVGVTTSQNANESPAVDPWEQFSADYHQ